MTDTARESGFLPPQQARSRAALERLLTAAEDVLAAQGLNEFTIAAVAERAGVSVGGVYRRFAGKEQLLDAVIDRLLGGLQDTMIESLRAAGPSLADVISALTHALAAYFARIGPVFSVVVNRPRTEDQREHGLRTLTTVQRLFFDAAVPYSSQIMHPAPSTALATALRTILAASAHRAAVTPWWPDGLTWLQWADEIADMATTYLTNPRSAAP